MSNKKDDQQEGKPPPGSIHFDDLIRRYLRTIGFKRFPTLTLLEVTRYALLTVFNTTQLHEPLDVDLETFWNRMLPEGSYAHVCLLPDTEEAHRYALQSGEDTIILKEILDVRSYMARSFLRLIWEEVQPFGESEEGIEDVPFEDEKSQDSRLADMKLIRNQVYSTMKPHHVRVMKLLFDGHSRAEVADMTGMTVANVTKIKLGFKAKVKRRWRKS